MPVAILPSGALLADTAPGDDEASDGLSVAARARVARAFARGPDTPSSTWGRPSWTRRSPLRSRP